MKIDVAYIVYLRTLAHGKQNYILRFEKYILCFEIGLSHYYFMAIRTWNIVRMKLPLKANFVSQ